MGVEAKTEALIKDINQNHAYLLSVNDQDSNNVINLLESSLLDKRVTTIENIMIIRPEKGNIAKQQILDIQARYKYASDNKAYIYMIESAEKMNSYAYNSLLKFLEEPESNIIAILITSKLNLIPSTIRSRCRIVHLTNEQKLEENVAEYEEAILKLKVSDYLGFINNVKDLCQENRNNLILFLEYLINKKEFEEKQVALIRLLDSAKYNLNINLVIDEIYNIIKAEKE